MKFRQEGFPCQILIRCPQEAIRRMRQLPLSRTLYITDIGHFPEAVSHRVVRENGATGHIFIYCTAGEGWCEVGGVRQTIRPEQAILIPEGAKHAYGTERDRFWKIYWIHFSGTESMDVLSMLEDTGNDNLIQLPQKELILTAFEECLRWVYHGYTDASLVAMSGALSKFLGLVCESARSPTLKARAVQERIRANLEYMRENINNSLSLSELANQTRLSIPHYCTMFKKCHGITPMMMFTRLKIQRACELLHYTSLSIRQIAEEVGYADPYHFSRNFKKTMGVSPGYYRDSEIVELS